MLKKMLVILLLLSLVFACSSCGGNRIAGTENGVYNRYNLHYISVKGGLIGSYANWTSAPGHGFVPYNTKFYVRELSRKKFQFVTSDGLTIIWAYDSTNMGMSPAEYIKLITSPTPINYEGLSDIDRQGIAAGKAMVGMSKQGVMIALGWKNRFTKRKVIFDDKGKVTSITE
jgi:hypothetical protein